MWVKKQRNYIFNTESIILKVQEKSDFYQVLLVTAHKSDLIGEFHDLGSAKKFALDEGRKILNLSIKQFD